MAKIKAGWIGQSLDLFGQLTTDSPNVPTTSFKHFNRIVGQPIHPDSGLPTDIMDYQEDYEQAWNKHHKVILNKSRKIGATETALRIIAYNCMNGTYQSRHRIMIVAGNKQTVANRFLSRFKAIFGKGFYDLDGTFWSTEEKLSKKDAEEGHKQLFNKQSAGDIVEMYNGINIQAYPANESVRGEENVACVFLSECAFINLLDDSKVYNAVHPNVSNIKDADFVLESTPNGKRGFFWELFTDPDNEYFKLEQPYTVSMGQLLDEEFIEQEQRNTKIDFGQEYDCKFTTSLTAVFSEDDVRYVDSPINTYDDL